MRLGENRMILIKRRETRVNESAVSPVVGVMLMLVVTIVIAAVVSAFSGGLVGGNNQNTPTIAMDATIVNSSAGMNFTATVSSVSDPIPTKNLLMSTIWTSGKSFGGGNSSTKIPYGFGPGVTGLVGLSSYTPNQTFGNYTLSPGTTLIVDNTDINTLLGTNSHTLNVGDSVTLRLIYTPTGKTIWQKNIVVIGG